MKASLETKELFYVAFETDMFDSPSFKKTLLFSLSVKLFQSLESQSTTAFELQISDDQLILFMKSNTEKVSFLKNRKSE